MNHWNVSTPDDEDTEEFTAMGFDYFSGPDLGLGDEYDMSRLPSQHLASFQSGFNPSEMNGKPGNNEGERATWYVDESQAGLPSQ
jgi:hypothetical protein